MLLTKYAESMLTGVACLAVARLFAATGVAFAELPDVTTAAKELGFDPWNMGAAGFVVWYAWYTTSRVIPQLTAEHRKDMAIQADKCAAERAEALRQYREEIALIRADHRDRDENNSGRQS